MKPVGQVTSIIKSEPAGVVLQIQSFEQGLEREIEASGTGGQNPEMLTWKLEASNETWHRKMKLLGEVVKILNF